MFTEFFQDRNQVIVSGSDRAVVQSDLAGGLAVLTDHEAVCEAVSIHIRIIAEIIL